MASTENLGFQTINNTSKCVFPDVVVAPFVMLGATDSKFYASLTPSIYKFSPIPLSDAQSAGAHGTNERISIKDYKNIIWFYVALFRNSQ